MDVDILITDMRLVRFLESFNSKTPTDECASNTAIGNINVLLQKLSILPPPSEGIFSKTPPPFWKFQLSCIHCLKVFGL